MPKRGPRSSHVYRHCGCVDQCQMSLWQQQHMCRHLTIAWSPRIPRAVAGTMRTRRGGDDARCSSTTASLSCVFIWATCQRVRGPCIVLWTCGWRSDLVISQWEEEGGGGECGGLVHCARRTFGLQDGGKAVIRVTACILTSDGGFILCAWLAEAAQRVAVGSGTTACPRVLCMLTCGPRAGSPVRCRVALAAPHKATGCCMLRGACCARGDCDVHQRAAWHV